MDRATAADLIDEIFSGLGSEAAYADGAVTVASCLVMPWRPQGERAWNGMALGGGLSVAEAGLYVLVRAEEVAAPARDGAFTLADDGPVYRIGEDAPIAHDVHGLVWRCRVAAEA